MKTPTVEEYMANLDAPYWAVFFARCRHCGGKLRELIVPVGTEATVEAVVASAAWFRVGWQCPCARVLPEPQTLRRQIGRALRSHGLAHPAHAPIASERV